MVRLAGGEDGLGTLVLDFLASKFDSSLREDEKRQLRRELMSAIYDDEEDESRGPYSPPSVADIRRYNLHKAFLVKLRYEKMEDRESRVAESYGSTFRWIFEDSPEKQQKWSNFRDWLKSDTQLYWITGKAGSGKSTLVKYICSAEVNTANETSTANEMSSFVPGQPRYAPFLAEWAKDCRLIIAVFYFWNSGIELQMTQLGLFRTLLTQIFEQAPELIPEVSPKRWEALCFFNEDNKDWTENELRKMLQSTVRCLGFDKKICLFIDGLDEFGGEHTELINLFKDLLKTPTVKLCVSSRPWVVFEDAFQKEPSLTLQDLTYSDIEQYVSSHLQADTGFSLLHMREPYYAEQLVENIVTKASGVFLWVRIVVSSLLSGLGHGDRISDLQKRLDSLPPELEKLYDNILSSLDPFYLEHAAQLFKLIQESTEPPSVLLLCYADEGDDYQKILDRPVQQISQSEAETIYEIVRRRLNSRCKGLLEAPAVYKNALDDLVVDVEKCTVQFLHRTVKDYIESPIVQQKLQLAMKTPIDFHLRICTGILAQLKTMDQTRIAINIGKFFRMHIYRFLNSAKRVSAANQDILIQLMDDLGKTCENLAKIVASQEYLWQGISSISLNTQERQVLANGQWIPFTSYSHFLSIATRFGILSYLRAKVNQGCLVQGISNKWDIEPVMSCTIRPLLFDAIDEEIPNPTIVKLFLERGADPNFNTAVGGSNWDHMRRKLGQFQRGIWKSSHDQQERWINTVILMIEHGAGYYSKRDRQLLLERLRNDRDMLSVEVSRQELVRSGVCPQSVYLSIAAFANDNERKLIRGKY